LSRSRCDLILSAAASFSLSFMQPEAATRNSTAIIVRRDMEDLLAGSSGAGLRAAHVDMVSLENAAEYRGQQQGREYDVGKPGVQRIDAREDARRIIGIRA